MLTEGEMKWLEDRAENLEIFGGYFCPNCPELVLEEGVMYCGRGGGEHCIDNPHKYAFKDVAEFEARVAKKLAYGVSYGELPCGADPDCPDKHMDKYNTKETPSLGCRKCVLRAARFEIEAKMEEEGKRV